MDHFYQIPGVGPDTDPMLEAVRRLPPSPERRRPFDSGTLVTGVTYRNPAFLAKTVTTLDVISGGRAIFGLGAAWNEEEHNGYGFDFPPVARAHGPARRGAHDRPRDVHRGSAELEGRYYRIDQALNVPRPIQPGGPRIMVGGGGEQRTLRSPRSTPT